MAGWVRLHSPQRLCFGTSTPWVGRKAAHPCLRMQAPTSLEDHRRLVQHTSISATHQKRSAECKKSQTRLRRGLLCPIASGFIHAGRFCLRTFRGTLKWGFNSELTKPSRDARPGPAQKFKTTLTLRVDLGAEKLDSTAKQPEPSSLIF